MTPIARTKAEFDLDYLQGFTLITETRRVVLTPGEHRLRFEGVADGIEPATAIVTGLPSGVIEKNRDAMLLSPSALVDAALGQQDRVLLNRTDPITGRVTRTPATVRSAGEGVVFETANGIEALRCTGQQEMFDFETSASGLAASPTLSVLTRVTERIEAVVQLSYLSTGFDWSADYVADRTATSSNKMDLGAWITLANSNSVSFKDARVQIVAGRVDHDDG